MEVECDNCKKKFEKKPYEVGRHNFHFCCRDCADKFKREHGKEFYCSDESTKRAREKIQLILEKKKYEKC